CYGNFLFSLFLLCLFGLSHSAVAHPKPSCRYPPSQWCRSLEIAIQCKVLKQCMELRAVTPQQNAPPVSLSVFYQSLCPAWRRFLSQQLFPTWTMLRDILTVHLVPYSSSEDVPSTWFFPCQPGEPECTTNMIEACVVQLTGSSALEIINCMESAADVLTAARPCLHLYAPALSWSFVQSCVNGSRGPQLMTRNTGLARALTPALLTCHGSPSTGYTFTAMCLRLVFKVFIWTCDLGGRRPVPLYFYGGLARNCK
uniref:Gamma-interferon-inducible lysosomal thiol reductase n=1 Tax=Neogobius melanostomus TaxID=47308 RepID=A0A8C6WQP0_9GOBI